MPYAVGHHEHKFITLLDTFNIFKILLGNRRTDMISQKSLLKLLAAGTFALTLAACGDGEAENAGEELDEIVTDAGNAVEDACEDVKEGANAEDKDC
jgi:hypothetical protein